MDKLVDQSVIRDALLGSSHALEIVREGDVSLIDAQKALESLECIASEPFERAALVLVRKLTPRSVSYLYDRCLGPRSDLPDHFAWRLVTVMLESTWRIDQLIHVCEFADKHSVTRYPNHIKERVSASLSEYMHGKTSEDNGLLDQIKFKMNMKYMLICYSTSAYFQSVVDTDNFELGLEGAFRRGNEAVKDVIVRHGPKHLIGRSDLMRVHMMRCDFGL